MMAGGDDRRPLLKRRPPWSLLIDPPNKVPVDGGRMGLVDAPNKVPVDGGRDDRGAKRIQMKK